MPHGGDVREVTDDHTARLGQAQPGISRPLFVACVQGDVVTVAGEQAGGHQPEAVGRSGDQ
jgi:hypothetical protein